MQDEIGGQLFEPDARRLDEVDHAGRFPGEMTRRLQVQHEDFSRAHDAIQRRAQLVGKHEQHSRLLVHHPPLDPRLVLGLAAEAGLHGAQEFGDFKGLGEVVVGAQVHARADVVAGHPGGQEDEGNRAAGLRRAQQLEHLVAVHVGHGDVTDDQRRRIGQRGGQAVPAVARLGDAEPLEIQDLDNLGSQRGVVLHHQDVYGIAHFRLRGRSERTAVLSDAGHETGSRRMNRVPTPGTEVNSIHPSWASTHCFTTSRPSPVPAVSPTFLARWK